MKNNTLKRKKKKNEKKISNINIYCYLCKSKSGLSFRWKSNPDIKIYKRKLNNYMILK